MLFSIKSVFSIRGFVLLLILSGTGCSSESQFIEKDSAPSVQTTFLEAPTASDDCASSSLRQWLSQRKEPRARQSSASTLSVYEISLPAFQRIKSQPGFFFTSQQVSIPVDAYSFQLMAFQESIQNSSVGIQVCSLTDPTGADQSVESSCALWYFGAAWMPALPSSQVLSGTWDFQVISGVQSGKLYLGVRSGNASSTPTLMVQPYLTGTEYTANDLQPAMDRVVSIYAAIGITIVTHDFETLSAPEFDQVSSDFTTAETADLICRGNLEVVNLFFVEDLSTSGTSIGTVLGIASGIPGPQGIRSRYNGVLIGLAGHEIANKSKVTLSTKLLGETAAHEMGHWMGLYHTTERDGATFDPLADTPECPIRLASNSSRGVSVSDCESRDGLNLMFWTAPSNLETEQVTLTLDQVDVISRAPLTQ